MSTFIGKDKPLQKYTNSTMYGNKVSSVRLIQKAEFDDDGNLQQFQAVQVFVGDGLILAGEFTADYPNYLLEEGHSGDYLLCAIQDVRGLEVEK